LLDDLAHRARHEAAGRGEDSEAMDLNALKDSHREGARRQARRIIVLDLLARQEKIQVETEELRERVDRLARLRGTTPRALVRDLGGDRFLRSLSREIRDKKVLAFLAGNAEITRKSVRLAPA
jgi:FKBP-type peptidyl-prolyl cis-trans isomerase (trigger factor)